jgi:hypothetical protein
MHHDGNLGITLATWIFALYREGLPPAHPGVASACEALGGEGASDELGRALVEISLQAIGTENPDFEAVRDALLSWYGAERLATDLGKATDREERVRAVRRYRFQRRLPWLACIIDRFPDGHVGPHWVMVEDLGEQVTIMDPFPWDQVDEQYSLPLIDFMVKWELGGLDGFWFRP